MTDGLVGMLYKPGAADHDHAVELSYDEGVEDAMLDLNHSDPADYKELEIRAFRGLRNSIGDEVRASYHLARMEVFGGAVKEIEGGGEL